MFVLTSAIKVDYFVGASTAQANGGRLIPYHLVKHGELIPRRGLIGLFGSLVFGQNVVPRGGGLEGIPSYLRKYRDALGGRATKSGNERVVVGAKLRVLQGAEQAVNWTWEYPGSLRLTLPSQRKTLVFAATDSSARTADEFQEQILEALVGDTPEAFLLPVQRGYIPRFLGDSFVVAGRTGFGSKVDVFEHGIPVAARKVAGASVKHFGFDAETGLLARVQYSRAVGKEYAAVVTELSRYEILGGYVMPRTILQTQGKKEVFRLDLESAVWGPRAADGIFSQEVK